MMRGMLTVLILLGFFWPGIVSFSQESDNVERIVIVTPEDCLLLEQHIPDDDVNYKPDVDVRGKPTVPAEVENTNGLLIGENGYSFYMTHDALKDNEIAQKYGIDNAQEGKIILGRVTVKDGDVLWNGTSLKNSQRNSIYLLCSDERSRKRRPIFKR